MNVQSTVSLLLLAVLFSVCALSNSMPASLREREARKTSQPLSQDVERARQMWNGARKAYKGLQKRMPAAPLSRRNRRQTATTEAQDLNNITGPKYMVDLFKNLTNSSTAQPTQANTIRSLPYTSKADPVCGEFNFSIASINQTEFILDTELHLFLPKQTEDTTGKSFIASISAVGPGGVILVDPFDTEFVVGSGENYVVFVVDQFLKKLIALGEKHAVFRVKIYGSVPDYENNEPLPCSNIKFINKDFTDENTPLFIVYTYDEKIENISYKQTIESMISSSPTLTNLNQRRKRTATGEEIPTCQVNPLEVQSSNIYDHMVGVDTEDFEVKFPASYNAGICGGLCTPTKPISSAHSTFLFFLLGDASFEHSYTIKQCCSPVRYRALQVFIQVEEQESITNSIHIIDDMIVEKCECLDVVDFGVN